MKKILELILTNPFLATSKSQTKTNTKVILRKNETSDEDFPSPKINGETKIDNPVENPPPANQPTPSVPSIEPGTEEAEVKPIGSN